METNREIDGNGYVTVYDNPIICAGVFQYKGSQLPDADPEKIYNVYRPIEEITTDEALKSFVGLPIINDHEMLGDKYGKGAEERGVHGSTLENIKTAGKDVLANLRIFSRTLKGLIDNGKKALSLGYSCRYEKSSGIFENMPYDYIQRNIRGNHLALVHQGRNGTVVLDNHIVFDEFDLILDNKEFNMADEDMKKPDMPEKVEGAKDSDTETGEKEMSVAELTAAIKSLMPLVGMVEELRGAKKETTEMALDKDTEEKEEKMEKAMDASDVTNIVKSVGVKSLMGEVAKRDALAKELINHVGTFDYSAMDSNDVAEYGVKKLELNAEKGTEHAVLGGFLAAAKKYDAVRKAGFAMDSANPKPKQDGLLAKRLGSAA